MKTSQEVHHARSLGRTLLHLMSGQLLHICGVMKADPNAHFHRRLGIVLDPCVCVCECVTVKKVLLKIV